MGNILRAELARASKVYRCCRCGGNIDKDEYHAAIRRRFLQQVRTDRAHYPLCRPLDPDGVLANGHIGQAAMAVVEQAAAAQQHGLRRLPRWLEKHDYSDSYGWEYSWVEEWDGAVQWGEAEYPSDDHMHVYGYKED